MFLTLLACASFDAELGAALQDTLDDGARSLDVTAATLAVQLSDGSTWEGAYGDVGPDASFRVGSITKTMVAAYALELHAEGALDLDAPVSDVLPEVPFADQITLRQCLNHSAGYADYAQDLGLLSNLADDHTPDQLIAYVDDALLFEPGTDYTYSNTGYVVVGLAIEAVTGVDYAQGIHQRYLDPLELPNSWMPTWTDGGALTPGFTAEVEATDAMSPTVPWASGELISSAPDLRRWADALYGGEVLTPDGLEQMLTDHGHGYGLAVYLEDVQGHASVGHSGSTHGYQARMRRVGEVIVVVAVNDFIAEADEIDAAVWALLDEKGLL